MKHSHHHDNLRSAGLQMKRGRTETTYPTARAVFDAGTFDHSQPEAKTLHPMGNDQGLGTVSDQQRLDLDKATERNQTVLNPIESSWPTPSE